MPTPTMRTMAPVAALLLLALAAAGCGGDKATEPTYTWPADFPGTPDQLMTNFRAAYEGMDAAALLATLRADHLTILQSSTVTQFPDVGPTLDMVEETRIHERMFSKQDVVDPDGSLVPGIQAITFQSFARQGTWGTSSAGDIFPETQYALYSVEVRFDRGQSHSILLVQGQLKVYVAARDSTTHGETRPFYQLMAQMDLTQNAAKTADTESSAWGAVKALFR